MSEEQPEAPRWVLPLLIGLLIAFWTVGTISTALTPTLLRDHPLALVALEPRNRNLLLVSHKVDAPPFMVLAVLRRLSSDPVYFALGFIYGATTLRWLEGRSGKLGRRFIRWVERIFPRFARPLVFLFPGLIVCLLAGVTRMRIRSFLLWNVAGTVAIVIVLRIFADRLEDPLRSSPWVSSPSTSCGSESREGQSLSRCVSCASTWTARTRRELRRRNSVTPRARIGACSTRSGGPWAADGM